MSLEHSVFWGVKELVVLVRSGQCSALPRGVAAVFCRRYHFLALS